MDGDPQSLPRQLRRGRFDLVYSGEGVLGHLDDLDGWALGIAAALRGNGELLVFDDHPVADCVDGFLHWRHDYFRAPADPDRLWRIGQVVSALARAGLHVEALEEYPGGTSRAPRPPRPGDVPPLRPARSRRAIRCQTPEVSKGLSR